MTEERETPREPEDESREDGPDVEELDQDPAYEPEDEGLKDLKGG